MAAMDPQFTHSKLVEAASLLRLPVGVLVDSLGLAPDIFNTSSPSAGRDTNNHHPLAGAMPTWTVGVGRRWAYRDADQVTSSDGSLPGFDASAENVSSSFSDATPLYPTPRRHLSLSIRRDGGASPVSPKHSSPSPGLLALHKMPSSPKLTVVSRRTSPGYGYAVSPQPIPTPTPSAYNYYPSSSQPLIKTEPVPALASSSQWMSEPLSSTEQLPTPVPARKPQADNAEEIPSGPVTKVWTLPPRIRRRKKARPDDRPSTKPKRDVREAKEGPKRRGPYNDETKKRNTALTRILKSCIRCRMNRGRCNPDPEDVYGACLTCKGITGPTLCKMPCYRYIITDASLYREQRAPYQVFTRRWQSMDIIDIPAGGWASSEVRTIVVSPNHIHAPFEFTVREFIPVDGDLLEEQWMTPHGTKETVPTPRFAVAEMHSTAEAMKRYIQSNMGKFIVDTVGNLDQLLWETYDAAFRHIQKAKTPEEQSLMLNTFRLWVTCRLISNPVHICGNDTLGGRPVYSADSLHHGKVPMPVMMTAQFECINYTTFLRPWSKAVLKQLNELVLAKKREYWLTIYYSMFILLHSCAMITKRDAETARQYDIKGPYANPESIRAHHSGAQTMLAHFHFINKGVVPFSLPHTAAGRQELAKAANLSDDEVAFVWRTARLVNEPERAARMRRARENQAVGDDLYWVSMLFDREWLPQANS